MLRGMPVEHSCVCALHTKGARRSCAHRNVPNTRAGFMKKLQQFEWPKLSQLCDLGSASMQIRLSPNFVVLLAHGMNSTQNKFGDYAPDRSGSLWLSKSTHLVHIRFVLLWVLWVVLWRGKKVIAQRVWWLIFQRCPTSKQSCGNCSSNHTLPPCNRIWASSTYI